MGLFKSKSNKGKKGNGRSKKGDRKEVSLEELLLALLTYLSLVQVFLVVFL